MTFTAFPIDLRRAAEADLLKGDSIRSVAKRHHISYRTALRWSRLLARTPAPADILRWRCESCSEFGTLVVGPVCRGCGATHDLYTSY